MTEMKDTDSVMGKSSDYLNASDALIIKRNKDVSSAEVYYDRRSFFSSNVYGVAALVEGAVFYLINRFYKKNLVLPEELNNFNQNDLVSKRNDLQNLNTTKSILESKGLSSSTLDSVIVADMNTYKSLDSQYTQYVAIKNDVENHNYIVNSVSVVSALPILALTFYGFLKAQKKLTKARDDLVQKIESKYDADLKDLNKKHGVNVFPGTGSSLSGD